MQCASKFHRSYLHSEIFSHIACQSPGMSADQKKLANILRARKSHVTSCGKHLQEALQEATTKSLVSRSLSLSLSFGSHKALARLAASLPRCSTLSRSAPKTQDGQGSQKSSTCPEPEAGGVHNVLDERSPSSNSKLREAII